MEKYMGKSVYKGTAIGPVNVLKKRDSIIRRVHVEDTEGELKRLFYVKFCKFLKRILNEAAR